MWTLYIAYIIIWLILPVVIRSSQRLSHACVSINILLWNCEWLIISVIVYLMKSTTWITVVILELIHDQFLDFEEVYLLEWKPIDFVCLWVIITCHIACLGSDVSFKFLPYQLSMVVYWTTMAVTGNEEFGFDFGEGAWETATTSKEGSRRVNYPILTQGGSDNKSQCGTSVLQLDWEQRTTLIDKQLEGKSGASSRGNSSSNSVY